MMRRFLVAMSCICASMSSGTAHAGAWKTKTTTDAMTDAVSTEAYVESAAGDRFTLLRRSDGNVWGYFQLGGHKQFAVGEYLMMRVDKEEARTLDDSLETLLATYGDGGSTWEWNPNLIGFRLWHGKADEGCGVIPSLVRGKKLVMRYHVNQSEVSDVVFSLNGNAEAITTALKLDLASCGPGPGGS